MNPLGLIWRNTTSGNDAVDMGMKHEVLPPGMQNAEETNLGSKMLGIARHLPKRLGNGAEQKVVEFLLILQD